MRDVTDLFVDLQNGTLPAVSYVKPDGAIDGHPASSKFDIFEAFAGNIIKLVAERTRSCGRIPRSSSPSTRVAATTTPASSSRSTSSAPARASR